MTVQDTAHGCAAFRRIFIIMLFSVLKSCTQDMVNTSPMVHCMFQFHRHHISSLSGSQSCWPVVVPIFPSQITKVFTLDDSYVCDFSTTLMFLLPWILSQIFYSQRRWLIIHTSVHFASIDNSSAIMKVKFSIQSRLHYINWISSILSIELFIGLATVDHQKIAADIPDHGLCQGI